MNSNPRNELPEPLGRALDALESRAARAAGTVDAARVADTVLRRLRSGETVPASRPVWQLTMVRVAAVLALLVVSATVARQRWYHGMPASRGNDTALVADSFAIADLDELFYAVDESAQEGAVSAFQPGFSLDDLTEQQLLTLLSTMDEEEST